MSDLLYGACVLFMVAVLLVLGVIGASAAYEATFGRWACQDFADTTGLETKWTLPLGCYVQDRGQWMSKEAYNQRNVQDRHQLEIK